MASKQVASTPAAISDPCHSTFHKNLGVPFGMPLLSCTGLAETSQDLWLGERKGSYHSNESQKIEKLLKLHPGIDQTKRLVIGVGPGALDLAPLAHTLVIADVAPSGLRATYLLTHALQTGILPEPWEQLINSIDPLPAKRPTCVSHESWAHLHEIHHNTKQALEEQEPALSSMGFDFDFPCFAPAIFAASAGLKSMPALYDPHIMHAVAALVGKGRLIFANMDCTADTNWASLQTQLAQHWPDTAQGPCLVHLSNLPYVYASLSPVEIKPLSATFISMAAQCLQASPTRPVLISYINGDSAENMEMISLLTTSSSPHVLSQLFAEAKLKEPISTSAIAFQTHYDALMSAGDLCLSTAVCKDGRTWEQVTLSSATHSGGIFRNHIKPWTFYCRTDAQTKTFISLQLPGLQQNIDITERTHTRIPALFNTKLSAKHYQNQYHLTLTSAEITYHTHPDLFPMWLVGSDYVTKTIQALATVAPTERHARLESFLQNAARILTWDQYIELLIWAAQQTEKEPEQLMALLVQPLANKQPISSLSRFYFQLCGRPHIWPEALREKRDPVMAHIHASGLTATYLRDPIA